ncbi:hypothetical protein D3C86_2079640 [compost metagenome]
MNILGDVADLPEEIDAEARKQFLVEADKKILNDSLDDVEWNSLQREIARARASLEIAPSAKK